MSLSITEIARMHKDFIYKQLNEIEQQLFTSSEEDQELVRRAVFSVRNKSVIFERYVPFSGNLYTIVQDVKSPNVTIEFTNNKINCTCPAKGPCRHKLAVLLSLFQYFDSVQDWTNSWRAKKTVEMSQLASERSPESWRALINEVMKPHISSEKRIEGYAIMTVVEMANTRLARYLPFEREWAPLFKLFSELGIFIHILRQNSHSTFQDSNQQYYMEYYADKAVEKIDRYVNDLASQSRLFSMDIFYDEIQSMALELIQINSKYNAIQLNIYLLLWRKLLNEHSRIEKEYAHLQSLYETASAETKNIIKPLLVLFNLKLNNYKQLQILLDDINVNEVEFYIKIVQYTNQTEQTEMSNYILKAILPYLKSFIQEVLPATSRQTFSYVIDQLYENVSLTEEEQLLLYTSLGKHGVMPFSNYLIRHQRFEEWAALHQLYPTSFSYLEACGLKTVLEHHPSVTLPLYHHFAMEELAQKSRMNYKQAVRIWKSMRTAAKKSGKTPYFEQYIQVIRTDYKRLRALQEELDKGNF